MSRLPGGEELFERPERYEIRVLAVLDRHWSAWFEGLELRREPGGVTVLAGPVTDQAALHGLLAKVVAWVCRCCRSAASTPSRGSQARRR